MPKITLPDGSARQYDSATTGADIAAGIGKSLARDAVAVRVNGDLYDLTRAIGDDADVEIVTRDRALLRRMGARHYTCQESDCHQREQETSSHGASSDLMGTGPFSRS